MPLEAGPRTPPDSLLTVREAVPDDAPATLALFLSVVEEGACTVTEPSEVAVTVDEERSLIGEARSTPGNLWLVASGEGGRVVGTVRASAGTHRRTRHFADVDSLWVDAAHRRRGVGGRLLSGLVSWAREHPQVEKLGLFVFSTNGAAIRLYGRHGFVVEGRYPRDVKFGDGTYADTVAMGLLVKERPAESGA